MFIYRSSLLRLTTFLLAVALFGCISSHEVNEDYHDKISVKFQSYRKRTIVLILIDGLGATLFSDNFGSTPQIENFFSVQKESFPLAHSVFPTLTFPNLASLLTLTPVTQHSVIGNKMFLQLPNKKSRRLLDFETRKDLVWLNEVKEPSLVYSQLNQKGRFSVSFAQSLFAGATAGNPGDLPMGASYLNKDYFNIDHRNIKALETLLRETSPSEWPDFIFLHLIGVDGFAHDFGPSSDKVGAYLTKLDNDLANTFQRLKLAQSNGHFIASILTADHGFVDVSKVSNLERHLEAKLPNSERINEGRTINLYFENQTEQEKAVPFIKHLAFQTDVDLTAMINKNELLIVSKHAEWKFTYRRDLTCTPYMVSVQYQNKDYCPDEIEKAIGVFQLPPFAFENLLAYFASPQHPDAVIIASEGVTFTDNYKGHHGGLSQQETLVPLLVNGIAIRNHRTPALFELLKVVFQ